MRFVVTADPEEFAAHAQELVDARPEHNIMATVLLAVRAGRLPAATTRFAYGVDDGRVRAAALRTTPWSLLAAGIDAANADDFIAAWLPGDASLDAVSAEPATARAIAAAWSRRTGGASRCRVREAMHILAAASRPARPARGRLRLATESDRALLVEWIEAFYLEAGIAAVGQGSTMVEAGLVRGGLHVWEDDGPASFVGVNPAVAGIARIGPVYTPPARRARGYASSAVAGASRWALESGASRCMLVTDLANPTSNRIYASLGYRRFASFEEHSLSPP